MERTEQTEHSALSEDSHSHLSANAASYIPKENSGGDNGSNVPPKSVPGLVTTATCSKSGLPTFMTSCYPFVTGDPGFRPRNQSPAGPQMVNANQNFARPPPPTGIVNQNPQFAAVNHLPSGNVSYSHNSPSPRPPLPYNGAQYIPFVNIHAPPPVLPFSIFDPHTSNLPTAAYLPPPAVAIPSQNVTGAQFAQFSTLPPGGTAPPTLQWIDGSLLQAAAPVYLQGSPAQVGFATNAVPPVSARMKQSTVVDKKTKSGTPSWRSGSHTIMCRDNSVQTDFNDELARLTLAERPNSLYLVCGDNVGISEDVDSDSGYSSPQHRQTSTAEIQKPPVSGCSNASPATASNAAPSSAHPSPQNSTTPNLQGISHNPMPQVPQTMTVLGLLPPPVAVPPPPVGFVPNGPGSNMDYRYPAEFGLKAMHSQNDNSCYVQFRPSWPQQALPEFSPRGYMMHMQQMRSPGQNWPKQSHQQQHYRPPYQQQQWHRPPSPQQQSFKSQTNTGKSATPLPQHSGPVGEPALPFNDVDEFPILLSAAGGLVATHGASCRFPSPSPSGFGVGLTVRGPGSNERRNGGQPGNTRQRRPTCPVDAVSKGGSIDPAEKTIPGLSLSERELKALRKKMKRQELVNRAAEKELAEISLEQHVLRELRSKQTTKQQSPSATERGADGTSATVPSTKVDSASCSVVPTTVAPTLPVESNKLADVCLPTSAASGEAAVGIAGDGVPSCAPAAAEVSNSSLSVPVDWASVVEKLKNAPSSASGLQSPREIKSAGAIPRTPTTMNDDKKAKKPSSLKKVIMKEREEKMKQHRMLNDGEFVDMGADPGVVVNGDSFNVDLLNRNGSPPSGDISPVSQMSPSNMSPMSASPIGSAGASPIAGNGILGPAGLNSILGKIHSRRFREYCNQVLDKEIDDCCTALLQDLVRFQEHGYSNNEPSSSSKSTRRLVMGLREVTKHLKLKQLKCVIISPNVERIQSKGGLDDALNNIIEISRQNNIPFVFALGRRALGRVCAKLVPVTCVGIFCYDGAEELFNRLCQLTECARSAYTEMVTGLEQDMMAALAVNSANVSADKDGGTSSPATPSNVVSARGPLTGNIGGFEKLFPHFGHSRTPSACSAISIISSVLSEPISEKNYPASEPEAEGTAATAAKEPAGRKVTDLDTVGESREEIADTVSEADKAIVGTVGEIDAGHEADTEDDSASVEETPRRSTSRPHSTTGRPKSEISGEHARLAAKNSVDLPPMAVEEISLPVVDSQPTPAIDSKQRIESWVVESQRAIEHMRASSGEELQEEDDEVIPVELSEQDGGENLEEDLDAVADLDLSAVDDVRDDGSDDGNSRPKEGQRDEEEGDDDADDDAASMKTVENDSSSESEYVEACETDVQLRG